MRALILRNDPDAAVESSRALIDKGFQILCVENRTIAETLIRMDTIDLLVMDEEVEGCLTHGIALSGERKNPYISAIIVTDRTSQETDDLYELIPSLYALVGSNTAPKLVGQLALSSVANVDDVRARVRRNLAADAADFVGDMAVETPQDLAVDPVPEVADAAVVAAPQPAVVTAVPAVADAAALIRLPETAKEASLAEDDIDIPSYADVIFATPALAELASEDYFDNAEEEDDVVGPLLPDFAGIAAQQPLVLTGGVPNGTPV